MRCRGSSRPASVTESNSPVPRTDGDAMPAYMIALNRTLRDRRKLEEYWKAAGPTFEGLGAKRLAIYTPLVLLEMMGPLDGAVVIEFPDLETAKRWYESPAY